VLTSRGWAGFTGNNPYNHQVSSVVSPELSKAFRSPMEKAASLLVLTCLMIFKPG
jgi:hypothetical protein